MEMSWVNATLLWANNAQGIGDGSIYDLNMTHGLPADQSRSFQVSSQIAGRISRSTST